MIDVLIHWAIQVVNKILVSIFALPLYLLMDWLKRKWTISYLSSQEQIVAGGFVYGFSTGTAEALSVVKSMPGWVDLIIWKITGRTKKDRTKAK